MKPGVNGRISAKAMSRFESLHECLLDQVLGFGFVAAQPPGGTKQPIAVRFNQLLKIKGLRSLGRCRALNLNHIQCVPATGKRVNHKQWLNQQRTNISNLVATSSTASETDEIVGRCGNSSLPRDFMTDILNKSIVLVL